MRRLVVLTAMLFVAGCAARQQPQPETPASVQSPTSRETGAIIGLTTQQLVGHFGNPALQVREGTSLKLQFRGRTCVLDAYLYPQSGVLRVTHVDTRTLAGYDSDQAACVASLE